MSKGRCRGCVILRGKSFSCGGKGSGVCPRNYVCHLGGQARTTIPGMFRGFQISIKGPSCCRRLFLDNFLGERLCSGVGHNIQSGNLLGLGKGSFCDYRIPCPPLTRRRHVTRVLVRYSHIVRIGRRGLSRLGRLGGRFLQGVFPTGNYSAPRVHFPKFANT